MQGLSQGEQEPRKSYRVLQRVLEEESQSYTEFGKASYFESLVPGFRQVICKGLIHLRNSSL